MIEFKTNLWISAKEVESVRCGISQLGKPYVTVLMRSGATVGDVREPGMPQGREWAEQRLVEVVDAVNEALR